MHQLLLPALLTAAAPVALAQSDVCWQEGSGSLDCKAPNVTSWKYRSVRCGPTYGPFGDEGAAVTAGANGEYLYPPCMWTIFDPGYWPVTQTTLGACMGTATVPQSVCKGDNGSVNCDIETHNQRNYRISFTFGTNCTGSNIDSLLVLRDREAKCDKGYDIAQLTSGAWMCKPKSLGQNRGEPGYCTGKGNPINVSSGNKYQKEVDYAAAGVFPLTLVRSYNSLGADDVDFGIGRGWITNYHLRLEYRTHGSVSAVLAARGDGKILVFFLNGTDWVPNAAVNDRLVRLTDGGGSPIGWQLTTAEGDRVETYDNGGRIVSLQDRAGVTQSVGYDASGRLASVTDAFGRQLVFTYDASGRIATVTDPEQQTYTYTYDALGNLVLVTYPGGAVRTYHYENSTYKYALTGVTDENGDRYATFAYSSVGRPYLSEHALGADRVSMSVGTSPPGKLYGSMGVYDALGKYRAYSFNITNGVARFSGVTEADEHCSLPKALTYDTNGNISTRKDFNNNRTNYTWDLARNLETVRVEGLTSTGATTAVTRTISTEWHAQFRLPTRIAEPKRITTLQYDNHGKLILKSVQATIDANGSLGFSANPTGPPRTWSYTHTYHASIPGFIIQTVVDGPRTDVTDTTTYGYDGTTGSLASVTNALGHVTVLGNFDAHGRARQITDPNGLVTSLTYDVRGRLSSRITGGETTSYEYDDVGLLIKVTAPDASYLGYTYDAAHRLTQIQDDLGNKIVYTLDPMGNRTREEVLDSALTLARKREREYSTLNRLTKDIGGVNPATEITQYTYDAQGNLKTIKDPFLKVTTNEYDPLNRLKKMIDPAASGSGQGGNTQYAYDGLDALTQVTDPRSLATTYTLDGLGNLTQQVSPDTGTTSTAYDTAGNLTGQTDARGVVATFTYDALNRLTQAVYTPPGGSGIAAVTRTYSYDQGTYGKGKLTAFTDPSGSTAYTWNQKGRLTAEARTIASVQYTTSYGYDSTGRLNHITYPSGRTVDYGFDALGRIQQIDTTAGAITQSVVSAVAYHPFGGTTGFTYGNATTYSRAYDLNDRVSGYTLGNLSRTLTYDAASRPTGFAHNQPVYDQTFGYDNLARLTAWSGNSTTRAFGYDAVHNRTSETIGASTYTYGYPGTSNRLASASGPIARSYSYDAAGNPTADGTHTFSHDAGGRLIHSTWGSINADYQINALGQRVYKAPSNAAATVFHYAAGGQLIAESNAAGQVQREYLYLGGIPVAVALGSAQADLYFIHSDHLDTPRVVTNSANTIVWRWDGADPFGGALASEDPDGNGQSFTLNLRFPGQYFDQETQLHYNYYRDYDPQTGRYLQPDPIGVVPGVGTSPMVPRQIRSHMQSTPLQQRLLRGLNHTYAYVESTPLHLIDPLGLYGTSDCTYYEQRCKEVGGIYYCHLAPAVCKNTPDNAWSTCVRQCLQEFDAGYCEAKNCGGGSDTPCIVNIHQMCWQECIGGGPPETYPPEY